MLENQKKFSKRFRKCLVNFEYYQEVGRATVELRPCISRLAPPPTLPDDRTETFTKSADVGKTAHCRVPKVYILVLSILID